MRPRHAPDPTPAAQRVGSRWWDSPGDLRGINLRSFLVLQLADARGSLTITELVDRARASGMRVDGRASKTISDALRWEVRRGRAIRLGRGHYRVGRLAGSTKHRMRQRLRACRARAQGPSTRVAHGSASVDDGAMVRLAVESLASGDVVARMRNRPATPSPDRPCNKGRPPPWRVRPGQPTASH